MSTPPIIFGFGGLVAGMVIGVAIGGSMVEDKINTAVSSAMQGAQETANEASAATEDAIAALGERIDQLETSLSESAASTSDVSQAVRTRLDEMQESLAARIDDVGEAASQNTDALRSAFQEMRDRMRSGMMGSASDSSAASESSGAGSGSDGSETEADASGSSDTDTDASQDSASSQATGDFSGGTQVAVGETARFADGAVRAFVSRLDAEGGSARISVNGVLVPLAVGEATTVSLDDRECSVQLTAVDAGSATLSSDCDGSDGSAAESASSDESTSSEQQAAADAAIASGEGYRPGETAQLADGLRVFVSSLAQDGSAARIAINGVRTETVASGESVEVSSQDQTCTVTVTGVGGGMVALEGSCG